MNRQNFTKKISDLKARIFSLEVALTCDSPGCAAQGPRVKVFLPWRMLKKARAAAKPLGWTMDPAILNMDYCPGHSR